MTAKIGMTEADLIQACLNNDRMAQKTLYDKYKKAMYTLAYRVTGDFESANDVLQDAFLKVFRGLSSFRGESTLGAWIKTIVIRTAYSKLRKNKIYFESIDQNHSQIRSEEVFIDGNQLDVKIINAFLKELPEGYKVVFSLYALEGYDHKEIGQILGISEATSKSQYSRARKKLKALINAKKKRSKHGTR